MKIKLKIILCLLSLMSGATFAQQTDYFVGMIHYKNLFKDKTGKDISKAVAPYFEMERFFYFDSSNYKVLDQNNSWVKLFNGKSNAYYYFNRDKTAYKIDVATRTTINLKVNKLPDTKYIAGYLCNTVEVVSDYRTIYYYYSPELKVNPTVYSKYYLEEWYAYLKAVEGALPLRIVTIERTRSFVEISDAVEIKKMPLTAADFEFPKDVKLKKLKFGIEMH